MLEVLAQLLARDLDRAERVFVRIDPHDVTLVHIALGQSRLHVEGRGGRQLRPCPAALHFIDEVEQRRILHARVSGIESRRRAADRGACPLARRFVRSGEPLGEARQFGHGSERDQVGVDARHAPAALLTAQRHVDHRQALDPVLRLHEMHTVDHRVADLAVRVPDDHDVRFRIHGRQRGGVVLGADTRGVVARFAEAAVDQHDLQVRAFTLHARERRGGGTGDPSHARAGELRAIPQHRAGRRKAGDADLHGAARQDHRLGEDRRAARVFDVRRDVAIRGLRGGAAQEVEAEVEVVVPRRDDVVLQRVQRVDDRLRLAVVVPAVERREGIAL